MKDAAHPVTMRDVAERAGVSVATVSLVINKKKNAPHRRRRPSTCARCDRRTRLPAQRLGENPREWQLALHRPRRRLDRDDSVCRPDHPWRAGRSLEARLRAAGGQHGGRPIGRSGSHLDDARTQGRGILYSTWFHRPAEIPDALRESDFVLVNCFSPDADARAVVPDEVQGGRAATEILIRHGHRRIAFINATIPAPAKDGRLAGYREALSAAGIAFDPALVFDAYPDQEGGYAAVDQLLGLNVTAVFCYNDRMAMGVYDGLRAHGLALPADMAVVGFDNQEIIAAHLRPPLSTVALPHYELGTAGVRLLLGVDQTGPDPVVKIECPPFERESVSWNPANRRA